MTAETVKEPGRMVSGRPPVTQLLIVSTRQQDTEVNQGTLQHNGRARPGPQMESPSTDTHQ